MPKQLFLALGNSPLLRVVAFSEVVFEGGEGHGEQVRLLTRNQSEQLFREVRLFSQFLES